MNTRNAANASPNPSPARVEVMSPSMRRSRPTTSGPAASAFARARASIPVDRSRPTTSNPASASGIATRPEPQPSSRTGPPACSASDRKNAMSSPPGMTAAIES